MKTCIGTQDIIQNTLPKTSPNRNASSLDLYTGAVKCLFCYARHSLIRSNNVIIYQDRLGTNPREKLY